MATFWLKDGVIISEAGQIILCDDCPCGSDLPSGGPDCASAVELTAANAEQEGVFTLGIGESMWWKFASGTFTSATITRSVDLGGTNTANAFEPPCPGTLVDSVGIVFDATPYALNIPAGATLVNIFDAMTCTVVFHI